MMMPGRSYTAGSGYRYGFNGKENDNEVKGEGNQQDYGFRIYDPRLGKFLSVDPLTQKYPELTPYQFASNSPIESIDLDGLEQVAVRGGVAAAAAGTTLQKKPTSRIVLKPLVLKVSQCHGKMSDDEASKAFFKGIGFENRADLNSLITIWEAVQKIDEISDYVPNPKTFVKKGIKKLRVVLKKGTKENSNKVDDVAKKEGILKNSEEGARREAEVTAEMQKDGGLVLEQKYIYGPDGKAAKASDGKMRRLDQVEVVDGKVKNAVETTSTTEATRSRKVKQVARGDELMGKDGMYIKGENGEKIPIPQGTKTQVKTKD